MTDAEGQIVWQAKYRPWGVIEKLVVNEVEQNLRFQGQYFDVETGLHYNTFRYYDPEIGRFITQDPIGLAGGVNLYQYAPNPIRWTDALGWACELFRGVSANHPAIDDAKRGVARPGKIDSDISPASHNGGDVSDISSYTSWTRDLEIAKWWANRQGPGGVILGTPTGAPKPGDTWRWEFSPDEYGESEILLKGIRDKLQVFTSDEL